MNQKLIWAIAVFIIAIPLANACTEGNQYFEGSCYPCESGVLYKKDNSVVCIDCNNGFVYNGEKCVLGESRQIFNNNNLEFVDNLSSRISPSNPFLGLVAIILVLGFIIYYLLKTKIKIK